MMLKADKVTCNDSCAGLSRRYVTVGVFPSHLLTQRVFVGEKEVDIKLLRFGSEVL